MGLRHAVLAALCDDEYSGYQLAKAFDVGVANFWSASSQQLYSELTRLEQAGLISGREVIQLDRPNKRVFTVTPAGLEELVKFAAADSKPLSFRDDLGSAEARPDQVVHPAQHGCDVRLQGQGRLQLPSPDLGGSEATDSEIGVLQARVRLSQLIGQPVGPTPIAGASVPVAEPLRLAVSQGDIALVSHDLPLRWRSTSAVVVDQSRTTCWNRMPPRQVK